MWCDHLASKHFNSKLQKAKGLYYGLFYLLENLSYGIVFEPVCKLSKFLHGLMGNILTKYISCFLMQHSKAPWVWTEYCAAKQLRAGQ